MRVKSDQSQYAIKYFEKAVELDPNNTDALYKLAFSYSLIGDNSKAIIFAKRLLTFGQDNYTAWDVIAVSSRELGDYRNSLIAYGEMLKLKQNGNDSFVLEKMGELYWLIGDVSSAQKIKDKLIFLNYAKAQELFNFFLSTGR